MAVVCGVEDVVTEVTRVVVELVWLVVVVVVVVVVATLFMWTFRLIEVFKSI